MLLKRGKYKMKNSLKVMVLLVLVLVKHCKRLPNWSRPVEERSLMRRTPVRKQRVDGEGLGCYSIRVVERP